MIGSFGEVDWMAATIPLRERSDAREILQLKLDSQTETQHALSMPFAQEALFR